MKYQGSDTCRCTCIDCHLLIMMVMISCFDATTAQVGPRSAWSRGSVDCGKRIRRGEERGRGERERWERDRE